MKTKLIFFMLLWVQVLYGAQKADAVLMVKFINTQD